MIIKDKGGNMKELFFASNKKSTPIGNLLKRDRQKSLRRFK